MYPPTLTTLSKNCHVLQLNAHDRVLFSYGKAVAGHIQGKFVLVDEPRTRTTSQHIAKFFAGNKADELVGPGFFRNLFGIVHTERVPWLNE